MVFFLRYGILNSFLQDFFSFSLNSLEGSTVTWPAWSLATTAWFYHFVVLWDIAHISFFLYSLWLPHPFLNFQLMSCHSLCTGRGGNIFHPKATCYGIWQSWDTLSSILQPSLDSAGVLLQKWHIKEATMLIHSFFLPANGVHSTGIFSSRLNYFPLLNIKVFYMGVISLPSGIINLVDRFISQGWSLKIKTHPYHTGPSLPVSPLFSRSNSPGFSPKAWACPAICGATSWPFQGACSVKLLCPWRITQSKPSLFYNFSAPLLFSPC